MLRLGAGILAARATASLIHATRIGGATTVPGRVARAFAPDILAALTRRLRHGTILVSGTNGKTTTSRLLAAILRAAGHSPIHNRAGANLPAGIAAALTARTTLRGTVGGDIGVFEVDEAAVPVVTRAAAPRAVVLGNLFRDQLDRYGEVDLVADRWRTALAQISPDAVVPYNADDPLVADVARDHPRALPFGIADPGAGSGAALEHAADARYCYRCGIPYTHTAVYLGHLGVYACGQCGAARPTPVVAAEEVRLHGITGSGFTLSTPAGRAAIITRLPGLYNVYNVLAAAAAAHAVQISLQTIADATAVFRPAFGRGERIEINGSAAAMLLAKNPAGFNEVLRTMLSDPGPVVAVVAINDLAADGRDISWLWDVDFEMLSGRARLIVTTGTRAEDMALRLKYAGVPPHAVRIEPHEDRAVRTGLAAVEDGRILYIVPTYTAMLRIRDLLARRGYVRPSWED